MNNNDIMTVKEVAKYLRTSERTIYAWVKNEEIPAFKLVNTRRFKKSEIDNWLETKRNTKI